MSLPAGSDNDERPPADIAPPSQPAPYPDPVISPWPAALRLGVLLAGASASWLAIWLLFELSRRIHS